MNMTGRNVVLICLDTVRKDYFDEYAPRLTQAADVSLDECRSVSSWTVPSHASIFTESLPHAHGVHAGNIDFSELDVSDTFLGRLQSHRSIGISANSYIDTAFGFDGLFDEFYDVVPSVIFPDGMYLRDFKSDQSGLSQYVEYIEQAVTHDNTVKSIFNGLSHVVRSHRPSILPQRGDDGAKAVSSLARQRVSRTDEPCFLFINYMDAHAPFYPTRRYDSDLHSAPRDWSSDEIDIWEFNNGSGEEYADDLGHYRDLYGAAIDYLDRNVTSLICEIDRITERETTFVVTSDHGENLGYAEEGGLIEHKGSLSEALLHVPFIVINPPETLDSEHGYFSHLNLGETIVHLAEGRFNPSFKRSLPAELIGLAGNTSGLSESDEAYWDRMIRAVYFGDTKYQWDSLGNQESYRVTPNDPCIQHDHDTDVRIPARAYEFFDGDIVSYKSSVESTNGDSFVDESVESRLEELGYM